MLVTIQPPSTQGQAPVPSSLEEHSRRLAGCGWHGTCQGGGSTCSHPPLHGSALPWAPIASRLSPVPPLLPFPLRAGCPRAPLLYLRVCLCLHGEEEGGWRSVLPQEPRAGQPGAETWRGKVEGEQWDTRVSTHKMKSVYYQLLWRAMGCLLSTRTNFLCALFFLKLH